MKILSISVSLKNPPFRNFDTASVYDTVLWFWNRERVYVNTINGWQKENTFDVLDKKDDLSKMMYGSLDARIQKGKSASVFII